MKKANGNFFGVILFGILLFCSACTAGETVQSGTAYNIYYVNQEETKIVDCWVAIWVIIPVVGSIYMLITSMLCM